MICRTSEITGILCFSMVVNIKLTIQILAFKVPKGRTSC
jgi:hypothetical protein